MTKRKVTKGDIWMIDYEDDNVIGSEQRIGYRPCLVIQNQIGNNKSTTTIVAFITSQIKTSLPTHMDIELYKPSTIMFEQVRTVSKERLVKKVCTLSEEQMEEADQKIMVSFGLI